MLQKLYIIMYINLFWKFKASFILKSLPVGHSSALQFISCIFSPLQTAPPFSSCLTIVLVWNCFPPPQLLLQVVALLQPLHSQSTWYWAISRFYVFWHMILKVHDERNFFEPHPDKSITNYLQDNSGHYSQILVYYLQYKKLHHFLRNWQWFGFAIVFHLRKVYCM